MRSFSQMSQCTTAFNRSGLLGCKVRVGVLHFVAGSGVSHDKCQTRHSQLKPLPQGLCLASRPGSRQILLRTDANSRPRRA